MHFAACPLPISICSSAEPLGLEWLGYFRPPFTTIPPEVEMTQFKYRSYPFLVAAIGVLASIGGAWRIG